MKNLLRATLMLLVGLTYSAYAGDYHSGATLFCNDCHVMHASQSHGYNSNGGGTFITPNGTHEYLLRDEVNNLCLQCHDNQGFAPDVLAANGGSVPTNGRQAGALNRDNTAPYFDATGHTLGSTDVAPGGTWVDATHGLTCISCHTQHGRSVTISGTSYGMYRNANVFINGTPTAPMMTYAIGTNDLTKDIFERSATYGGDHYSPENIDFNEPDPTKSGYGNYCKQCHTNFHGSSSDANMRNTAGPTQTEWYRHPTADANIGAVGGGHSNLSRFRSNLYRGKVMSATGDWGTQGTAWTASPTDLTPSCMSCHRSHGSTNAFGLVFATGTVPIDENGDGTNYRQTCGQCHSQGPTQ
jgi:hypothetical protein